MKEHRNAAQATGAWSSREAYLLALVSLMAGLAIGYLFRGSSSTIPVAQAAAPGIPSGGPSGAKAPLHSAEAVRPLAEPWLALLQANPKNFDALVQLGNLYYDNHVYPEAIENYKKALELRPDDFNVRTDMGTAYWYSGFADHAVAEYKKALLARPSYPPTLLNLGIVRLEGLKDPAGAIAAWEELLKNNPEYPEKSRVVDLIARAKPGSAGVSPAPR